MTCLHWDRHRITSTVVREYTEFAALVGGLIEAELEVPTRCPGWTVRHVAGHLAGTAIDILDGTIGRRTPDEQATAFRTATGPHLGTVLTEAARRLWIHLASLDTSVWDGPCEGVPGQSFSTGVLTLVHELCVHTDDIDSALGRTSIGDEMLEISVAWLAAELDRVGFEPVTIELGHLAPLDICGGGPVIRTDPLTFMRVATGRSDPREIGIDSRVNIYGRARGHVGV